MGYNDKESGAFDITANEMLRRLNNQYKADKFADKYTENSEYVKADDGSIQIDISTLSDDEFKVLFDSYLETSKMNVNMTESTYKSLKYHIANLQQKSGAMLLSENEMEKRFAEADAARKLWESEDTEEDAEEHFTLPEIPVPEHKILKFDEEEAGEEAVPEEIPEVTEEAAEEPAEEKTEEKSGAEELKKRRMSIFSRLKALMHEEEAEETEAAVPAEEEAVTETEEAEVTEEAAEETAAEVLPKEETDISEIPDDDDIEGATEEFISPFTAEREAVYASETMEETEIFDSFSTGETTLEEEETTPEEEMLENHVDDTSELEAYEPDVTLQAEDAEADEEALLQTDEEFEAPLDVPEEEDEVPGEIVPEEPDAEALGEGEEAAVLPEDAEIIDAFVADPIEDYEDVPKHIFEETSYETEELDYPKETAEEEPEESDGYVSFDQNPDILEEYRKKYTSVRIRMGISAFLAVLLLVIENIGIFGVELPEFMRSAAFMVPFEWTVIFAAGFLVCDVLWNALKKLAKFEFEPATVTFLAFVLAAAATLSALFEGGEPKFFGFPFVLCVFFNLLSVFISIRKEIFSFKIISSAKRKHAVTLMSAKESKPETEEFMDYLSENSQCYRAHEADFVGGYFAKKKQAPKMYKKLRILVPAAFCAALAVAVVSAAWAQAGVYSSLVKAYLTFIMCAPAAVFFANELPMYLSSLNAYSNNSAILGDSAPEMMENMSSVSFTDKDVFQNDGVRIKGVKLIDNSRIDHIIYYATAVFDIVGGPLAKVFKQASLENSEPESAEVRVISSKGIDAMVDGKHIVMGVHQFMDAQCFNPVREAGDEQWEGKTNKRILYLACDEELIAKFYVEYNVNPEFVYLVKKLSKAGVCVGVRTNDPCVDVDIFYKNKLSPEQYPLRVIKGADAPEENYNASAKKTSLVAAGSLKGLVKTILVCDRLRNVLSTNFVIKAVAAIVGLLIMGFIVFSGVSFAGVWSLYFALYQLLWIAPVYVISRIYI